MTRAAPRYCPFYCEENAWHLLGDAPWGEGVDAAWAVAVTNARGAAALWYQRAAPVPGEPVLWDYHVFAVSERAGQRTVWDPDTTLGMPCDGPTYVERTFQPTRMVGTPWAPMFRRVAAARYRGRFTSDRSHMRGEDGAWLQPPPSWPAIGPGHSLPALLDLGDPAFGPWCDLTTFSGWLDP